MTASHCVLLSVEEYAALRAAAARPPVEMTAEGLAAAVGLIAAKIGRIPARLAPGTDPAAVIAALVTITAAAVQATTADEGADLLGALGLVAEGSTR